MIAHSTSAALLMLVALATQAGAQEVRACARAPRAVQEAAERDLRARVDSGAHIGSFHLTCGTDTALVAAAWLPGRDRKGDYGPRVVTLRHTAAGWTLGSVLRGLGDSHLTELKVFATPGRVLVLADLGDEGGSWGIGTYELVGTEIVELGLLNVGIPTDENDQAATDVAAVTRVGEQWQVSFARRVVLRPNQDSREVVPLRNGRGIDFRRDGEKWRRVH